MKKLLIIPLLVTASMVIAQPRVQEKTHPLIPMPNGYKASAEDLFVLTSQTKLVLMNEQFRPEVDLLQGYLKTNYGFELPLVKVLPSDGNYMIVTQPEGETGKREDYDLSINVNQVLFA